MFRMSVHPSSGACDLLWIYFMCCIALVRCVWCYGVVRLGGVVSSDTQPNRTVTPTHIEPEKYNTWNKFTVSRKLLKMDVLTFETCWAVNGVIIKRVTSSLSIFIQQKKFISMYVRKQFSRYSPTVFWRQSIRFLSLATLKSLMYSARLENEETLHQQIFYAFQITRSCPGTFETVRNCMIGRVDACIVSAARYFEIFFKRIMTW